MVGKFYWNNGDRPGIHSFARGGRFIALRHSLESATEAISEAEGNKDRIVCVLALLYADPLETDLALKTACKTLHLGNKTKTLSNAVESHRRRHKISAMKSCDDANKEFEGAVVPRGTTLMPEDFPHVRTVSEENVRPIDHLENVEYLLDRYGFSFHYDQILKEIEWLHPELDSSGDNASEQLYAELLGLCSKNDVPYRSLAAHMIAIADRRAINPVTDYLRALEWDGKSRFDAILKAFDTEDQEIFLIAMRIFLIQACAAADHASEAARQNSNYVPSFESVIVFVSEQGRGKTKGFKRLIPEQLRRYHKEGVELDPRNKDSVKKAVSAWIVELGELDGTFRKADIAALKAHLSSGVDELRMPYARTASKFKRRAVYIGTVNEEQFLADGTGNRRFLPIKTDQVRVNWSAEEIDQLWAEAWVRYIGGEQWWPTTEEEQLLADHTDQYRSRSWIEENLGSKFDWDAPISNDLKRKPATEIFSELQGIGHSHAARPSQRDLKDVGQCMKRRWASHPQVIKRGGNLYLNVAGVEHKIHHEGGKTNGWLVPPLETKCTPKGSYRS
ncbi:Virulence-associated protein E [Roseovarius marisflavi]|uniref:Virulence-associated protein E n=2 Tax=Roseovarius marisflavi TaxID=1054996 RepID=A0A1M6WA62_9RHOB|nr:Virulence-associated protein E [Roseovarius marisflavi]